MRRSDASCILLHCAVLPVAFTSRSPSWRQVRDALLSLFTSVHHCLYTFNNVDDQPNQLATTPSRIDTYKEILTHLLSLLRFAQTQSAAPLDELEPYSHKICTEWILGSQPSESKWLKKEVDTLGDCFDGKRGEDCLDRVNVLVFETLRAIRLEIGKWDKEEARAFRRECLEVYWEFMEGGAYPKVVKELCALSEGKTSAGPGAHDGMTGCPSHVLRIL